jgi:hypothetical protein
MLIGMIFLNPFLGAAVGAGAGALSGALTDIGVDDKMMKELAASRNPGCSAVFVLVRKATGDKVFDGLKEFTGKRYADHPLIRRSPMTTRFRSARGGVSGKFLVAIARVHLGESETCTR